MVRIRVRIGVRLRVRVKGIPFLILFVAGCVEVVDTLFQPDFLLG